MGSIHLRCDPQSNCHLPYSNFCVCGHHSNIFFAIGPLLNPVQGRGADIAMALSTSMRGFKAFLETRGAQLSRTPEFLPFYALPYIPDPAGHPTFRTLFDDAWMADLRRRLQEFLR
eukprot:SAG31_NODE_28136_length_415_cov_0.645570_1_plen_115_part_10